MTLIMYARGMIIKSGINDNKFRGILDGPVDLFSSELIMSNIQLCRFVIINCFPTNIQLCRFVIINCISSLDM